MLFIFTGGSQREFGSAWTRSEYTYDTVEMFDIFNMTWQQVAPMNNGRLLPGTAVLNGKGIYVNIDFVLILGLISVLKIGL